MKNKVIYFIKTTSLEDFSHISQVLSLIKIFFRMVYNKKKRCFLNYFFHEIRLTIQKSCHIIFFFRKSHHAKTKNLPDIFHNHSSRDTQKKQGNFSFRYYKFFNILLVPY